MEEETGPSLGGGGGEGGVAKRRQNEKCTKPLETGEKKRHQNAETLHVLAVKVLKWRMEKKLVERSCVVGW